MIYGAGHRGMLLGIALVVTMANCSARITAVLTL